MEKIFINKEIEITYGENALSLIRDKNDEKYFEDGIGIKKIDKNRWGEAQDYERKTWCIGPGKNCIEDRNQEHAINFGGYQILNSILTNNISVIELGCGPFTNLKLIIPTINKSISKIDLLDPLIYDYILSSPNCNYKSKILGGMNVNFISSSIEEFQVLQKYDLVVMINVLEHCFNLDLIFEKMFSMIKENGILIFADRTYNESSLQEIIKNIYDAGHPIRISDNYIEEKIKKMKILFSNQFPGDFGSTNKYLILQNNG